MNNTQQTTDIEMKPRSKATKEIKEMKIALKEIEYCKVGISYEADPEIVKNKRNTVAKEMGRSYEVKGFRRGKASPEVIKLTYPKEVQSFLKQEMLNQAFQDVVINENIKPFGGPTVESVSLEGNNFNCEMSVHTIPQFELKEYKGFDLPKPDIGTTIEEISQQILQDLRTEQADVMPYGEADFVQTGDSVVVQYEAFLDGEKAEKLSSEGTVLEVGRINVAGFDDQLLGMKPGEDKEFTLTTPEKDFDPDYLGKEITFKLKLMTGSKKVPAALDDALAVKIGLKDYADLETQIKGVAGAKVQGLEAGHFQDQVGRRLIANHDFIVPSWISLPEAKVQVQMQKKKWEDLNKEEQDKLIKDAEDGIKLSLILSKIQDEEPSAQMTQEEMLEVAKKNISQYTQNPDQVMQDIASKGQMNAFLGRIKDEHTLTFIINNCNIVE